MILFSSGKWDLPISELEGDDRETKRHNDKMHNAKHQMRP
jgi:hypothetical protein